MHNLGDKHSTRSGLYPRVSSHNRKKMSHRGRSAVYVRYRMSMSHRWLNIEPAMAECLVFDVVQVSV